MGWGGALRAGAGGPPRPQPHLLADVLPGEDLPAGFAFKAPQVPLLFQRQQRLPVLDVPSAAGTVWKRAAGGSYYTFIVLTSSARPALNPGCPHLRLNKYLRKHHLILLLPRTVSPRSLAGPILTRHEPPWILGDGRDPLRSSWPGDYLRRVSWP